MSAAARRTPRLAALLVGLVTALIAWSPVVGATSWSGATQASTSHAWADTGHSLARTVSSTGTIKLHHVFGRDVIGGENVSDSGPYLGVYYKRGNSTGTTWSASTRLNPSDEHGSYGAVATAGKYVYTAWRTEASYDNYDPYAARYLEFRRNTSYGASTAWKTLKILDFGRIDRPAIAASGSRVFVAYTDTYGGEIRVARSTDSGATFEPYVTVGATSDGQGGFPDIAITGSTVVIAWNSGNAMQTRISSNGGSTWGPTKDMGPNGGRSFSVAAASGRVGLAWTDPTVGGYVRIWKDGTWGSTRQFGTFGPAATYDRSRAVDIVLTGTSRVGVAFDACLSDGCGSAPGIDVRWRESNDNGKTWYAAKTVGSHTTSSSRLDNEDPTALYLSSTRRLVIWSAYGLNDEYRTLIRLGSGTP